MTQQPNESKSPRIIVVRQIEYGSFDNGLTALLGQTRATDARSGRLKKVLLASSQN
jgi:hypothetical protein